MAQDEKVGYEVNHAMWTAKGDRLTTIGDFLGRLPSIELLNPEPGEKILDAGCGAGFNARRLARLDAKVYGCDRAEKMLAQAQVHEAKDRLGIEYRLADITALPYADQFFDAVFCVAVLIHDSVKECQTFFREALRVLKPGGRLVVSITHANLYQPNSPNRTGRASWAQYRALEDKPLTVSQRFEEVYKDSLGNVFTSTVWYHPEPLFSELLFEAGFVVTDDHVRYVTAEVLKACNQTGEVGYKAFYQVVAVKPSDG